MALNGLNQVNVEFIWVEVAPTHENPHAAIGICSSLLFNPSVYSLMCREIDYHTLGTCLFTKIYVIHVQRICKFSKLLPPPLNSQILLQIAAPSIEIDYHTLVNFEMPRWPGFLIILNVICDQVVEI